VLVSGDEDFAYAINAVAYKGVRVELAGFRSNTSPRLIDVADQFIELDSHLEEITKAESRFNHNYHSGSYHISTRTSGAFIRVQEEIQQVQQVPEPEIEPEPPREAVIDQ
jgi:NYN domain